MRKRYIYILLLIALFTTGCTCEYNLKTDGEYFEEVINLTAENETEVSQFKTEWAIPTNKSEYSMPGDADSTPEYKNTYDYSLNNKVLKFRHEFSLNRYSNSTAVSICFDNIKAYSKDDTTVLSTISKAECFEKYQQLKNVTINIKSTKEVISHNADNVKNDVYTWYLNPSNAANKSINITLSTPTSNKNDDKYKTISQPKSSSMISSSSYIVSSNSSIKSSSTNSNLNVPENNITTYIAYAIIALLLLVIIIVALKFYKTSQENNRMND